MEPMREILRSTLGRSLRNIREEDRLSAAWIVACGCAMADRGRVIGYEAGVLRIEVADAVWLRQMVSLRAVLEREIARVACLPIAEIRFELRKG